MEIHKVPTSAQRAAMAVEALSSLEAEYQQNNNEQKHRKTIERELFVSAAKKFGTNAEYVRKLKRVKKIDPERFEEIKAGKAFLDRPLRGTANTQDHVLVVNGKKIVPFSFSAQLSDLAISQLERIQLDDPRRTESLTKVRNYIDLQLTLKPKRKRSQE